MTKTSAFFSDTDSEQHNQVESSAIPIASVASQREASAEAGMREEWMPFTVKIIDSEQDLDKAVSVRHTAYARHVPAVAALLTVAEAYDRDAGSVVVLAESKLDGSALGTMRIQTNRYRKLALEESVALPAWLQGKSLAEATRLGVSQGSMGRVVKTALFKAYFHYCQLAEIDWMVIAARSPLDRQYEALQFEDIYPAGEFIPMRHAGNIPHRVLAFDVAAAEQNWTKAKHPLFDYIFRTHHRDIDITKENVSFFTEQSVDLRIA
jgi:hypothetical protein